MSLRKREETGPDRIEINHRNSILSMFYHGLAFMSLFNQSLSLARGKTMRHKWSARGKTMIKWSTVIYILIDMNQFEQQLAYSSTCLTSKAVE